MWQNLTLNELANLIILISAVIVAGKTIWEFIKQPVDAAGKKIKSNSAKHIEEVLDAKLEAKLPVLMAQNCNVLMTSLNEIKALNISQEEQLHDLQESLDLLNTSQLDMLRYDMNRIYYKYLPYKQILDADKKAFLQLYNDYKPMGGNSWIDSLYHELKEWPIVQSSDELKK